MPRKRAPHSQHRVDDQQVLPAECSTRGNLTDNDVQSRNHEERKHNVDRQRNDRQVSGMPQHLNVGNPIAVGNNQHHTNQHRTFANSGRRFLSKHLEFSANPRRSGILPDTRGYRFPNLYITFVGDADLRPLRTPLNQ